MIKALLVTGILSIFSIDNGCTIGKIASEPFPKGPIVMPNEMIVSEQYLIEWPDGIDLAPPTILSYWPDLSYGDGTMTDAILRCEDMGGEMVVYKDRYFGGYVHKCENVDY